MIRRNGPLAIPSYKIGREVSDYDWQGVQTGVGDLPRLPVLWNHRNVKEVGGNILIYAGERGRPEPGRRVRIPKMAVGLLFPMFHDFVSRRRADIDRVGLLVVGWIQDNFLTQAVLYDWDRNPIPASRHLGGELYAVTGLSLIYDHYDQYSRRVEHSFPYESYRPIVEQLPSGTHVFRGWQVYQQKAYEDVSQYLYETVELPALQADIELIRAALKRYKRSRTVVGVEKMTLRYEGGPVGVTGPHFMTVPFPDEGNLFPPELAENEYMIDSWEILTGPSPEFPSEPLQTHHWYELMQYDPRLFSNQAAINQYVALVHSAAARIGGDCVVMNFDENVEQAIQEDIAEFFGL